MWTEKEIKEKIKELKERIAPNKIEFKLKWVLGETKEN